MGTRADFYRENPDGGLMWIASIAWDGFPEAMEIKAENDTTYLIDCETEDQYLEFLSNFFSGRDDVTYPQQGWPWPWETSAITDYAYVFSKKKEEVLIACFGRGWYTQREWNEVANKPSDLDQPKVTNFPDMSSIMNVAWDSNHSGLIIFGEKSE